MHNQQNHNHQEHHHAEGDAAATTATAKPSMAAAASRKRRCADRTRPSPSRSWRERLRRRRPDDPDEESDRLAAAPLPAANVSAGKSPVWTAPAAPKIENAVTALPGVDSARVLFATENWWSTHSPISACGSRTRSPRPVLPCSALRPPKMPRQKPRASANCAAAVVNHPDGGQLGAGSD